VPRLEDDEFTDRHALTHAIQTYNRTQSRGA